MGIATTDENCAVGAAARVHLERIDALMLQGRIHEAQDSARDLETLLRGVRQSDRVLDGLLDQLRAYLPSEPSTSARPAPTPPWTRLVVLGAILLFVFGVSMWPSIRERRAATNLRAAANQCLTLEEDFARRVREGVGSKEFVTEVRATIEPAYESLRLVWVESRAGYGANGPSSTSEAGRAMAAWRSVADEVSRRGQAEFVLKMSDTRIPFDVLAPRTGMDEGDRQGLEVADEAVRAGRKAWNEGN